MTERPSYTGAIRDVEMALKSHLTLELSAGEVLAAPKNPGNFSRSGGS